MAPSPGTSSPRNSASAGFAFGSGTAAAGAPGTNGRDQGESANVAPGEGLRPLGRRPAGEARVPRSKWSRAPTAGTSGTSACRIHGRTPKQARRDDWRNSFLLLLGYSTFVFRGFGRAQLSPPRALIGRGIFLFGLLLVPL